VPSFTLSPVTAFGASLAPLTALFASFFPATAFFFSWAAPTEFFGSTSLPAAWPIGVAPKTATTRAVTAMIVVSFEFSVVALLLVRGPIQGRSAGRPAEYGEPSLEVRPAAPRRAHCVPRMTQAAARPSYSSHARRAVFAQ
jgi:hypothetical protein